MTSVNVHWIFVHWCISKLTRQGPRLTLGSQTGERTPKKVVFQLWRSVSQPKKNSTVKISPSQLGVYCQNCGSNVRIVVQIVMNEQYTYFKQSQAGTLSKIDLLLGAPQFEQKHLSLSKVVIPPENGQFWRPKKGKMGAKKKDIPRIHMDKYILQKTGSKLVIFGLCGLIYNLHPHIWGRHRVLYFTTQMTEKYSTAMC